MSSYNDKRRDSARQRQASRRASEEVPSRAARGGKVASLRDLHQVSPEMRERYGVTGSQPSRRTDRYSDEWDYYEEPRSTRRAREANDWRSPSVDPIGGRNIRGGSNGGNGLASRVNLPIIIALAVVLVLLVAIIVVAMGRCSGGSAGVEPQDTQSTQAGQTASSGEAGSSSTSQTTSSSAESSSAGASDGIDRAKLVSILDEDIADKLINRATTSDDAKWIAQNPDKYSMDGEAVERKLLKLAADEPGAQTFVRNFPDKYPMATPATGKVNSVMTGKNIPRFFQWDELWGYTTYSGTAFGLTGCGPTCLAMVYQGVTGNNDLGPYEMGELAVRDGYASDFEGTYANFFTEEASMLNLPVTEIDITSKSLKNAIQSGQVVIANFAPGIFTEYGHYVVISGQRQDGTLIMNDPYSEERSNKSWDVDTIVNESQGLYAYG